MARVSLIKEGERPELSGDARAHFEDAARRHFVQLAEEVFGRSRAAGMEIADAQQSEGLVKREPRPRSWRR